MAQLRLVLVLVVLTFQTGQRIPGGRLVGNAGAGVVSARRHADQGRSR